MKLNSLLSAGLFAAVIAFSFSVQASDADKAAEAKAPASEAQAGTSPANKVKPDSHAEGNTGAPQKAPEIKSERPNLARDRTRHYHPRDGK